MCVCIRDAECEVFLLSLSCHSSVWAVPFYTQAGGAALRRHLRLSHAARQQQERPQLATACWARREGREGEGEGSITNDLPAGRAAQSYTGLLLQPTSLTQQCKIKSRQVKHTANVTAFLFLFHQTDTTTRWITLVLGVVVACKKHAWQGRQAEHDIGREVTTHTRHTRSMWEPSLSARGAAPCGQKRRYRDDMLIYAKRGMVFFPGSIWRLTAGKAAYHAMVKVLLLLR